MRSDFQPYTLTCPVCNKQKVVPKWRIKQGKKYCSRECAAKRKTMPVKSIAIRFWNKVNKTDTCWFWTGARNNMGYGQITLGHRFEGKGLAHRIAWELINGQLPNGAVLCHICDNPSCVRPDHMFLGTKADNSADMVSKGRSICGEAHCFAKLTKEQVINIRSECAKNQSKQRDIAKRFGVSEQ